MNSLKDHMAESTINTTRAKAHFSEIAAHAAFGGKTYIVERMGKPFVVIMSYNEFRQLKKGLPRTDSLTEAAKLRSYLNRKYGRPKKDSTSTIREMREERSRQLST